MNRRLFIKQVGAACLAGAGTLSSLDAGSWKPGTTQSPKIPLNFILINVDDLGWTDLGCYGSRFYETPNIDRLAAEGIRPLSRPYRCHGLDPSPGQGSPQSRRHRGKSHRLRGRARPEVPLPAQSLLDGTG
jgi:hypothetical protein